MFEINDKLRAMNRKRQEAENLQAQLEKQLEFENKWKVAPHDFQSYTLIPKGRNERGFILYHTNVLMKDGSRITLPTNVRKDLHPFLWEERK